MLRMHFETVGYPRYCVRVNKRSVVTAQLFQPNRLTACQIERARATFSNSGRSTGRLMTAKKNAEILVNLLFRALRTYAQWLAGRVRYTFDRGRWLQRRR
jgi:hypothetical protein